MSKHHTLDGESHEHTVSAITSLWSWIQALVKKIEGKNDAQSTAEPEKASLDMLLSVQIRIPVEIQ